ncbi:putative bifunctional diguanylate cyclase/phosphodiesterase [Algirhabdus cladophorae]|uniref:putative bifunctional diguanylate cyclase/phosphodiesterase n=1 Tax=Algirhabdus cladophorae TaxID=3377108 RepID=UPI003B848690
MSLDNEHSNKTRALAAAAANRFDVLRGVRTAIWVYDIDTSRVAYANDLAVKLWDAPSEEVLQARDLSHGMSKTVRDRLRQYQHDFSTHNADFNELWTLYPNGVPTSVMLNFSGYVLHDGRMAMLCQAVDQGQGTPENIRSTEALLYTDVLIALVNDKGQSLYMNPSARNSIKHIESRFRAQFIDPEDHDDLMHVVASRGEAQSVVQMHTMFGPSWYDLSVKKCTDAVTGSLAFLITAVDVTELKTARDKARFLADCDQLTGSFNRAYLSRKMEKIRNDRGEVPRAILCLDVDRFKHINDRFGHEVGDRVLCALTDRIQNCLTPKDILARFGGDEFVILLDGVSDSKTLMSRAAKIRDTINQPIHLTTARLLTSCSIGGALIPEVYTDWADYMKQADIALYAAKEAGRDRCMTFDSEMGRAAKERSQIEHDLKEALEQGQFQLHYQPRVDTLTQKVVSVEALVRWQHPTRGMISPGAFIPICEETGIIEELGHFVLTEGCNTLIKWHRAGVKIGMSLNVSPRQFLDDKLMDIITDIASGPEFPKGIIELEITENVLIGDHDLIAERLRQMTELGFRIAIDDFGTGYSNLAYISLFPLDCIKIDKSFIDQLPTSEPIIRLIKTLSDQIGASSVAEGVETKIQANCLAEIGCHQIQGYYYSKPMPEDDVLKRIAELGINEAPNTAVLCAAQGSNQSICKKTPSAAVAK